MCISCLMISILLGYAASTHNDNLCCCRCCHHRSHLSWDVKQQSHAVIKYLIWQILTKLSGSHQSVVRIVQSFRDFQLCSFNFYLCHLAGEIKFLSSFFFTLKRCITTTYLAIISAKFRKCLLFVIVFFTVFINLTFVHIWA